MRSAYTLNTILRATKMVLILLTVKVLVSFAHFALF